jgi:hypothetical protein
MEGNTLGIFEGRSFQKQQYSVAPESGVRCLFSEPTTFTGNWRFRRSFNCALSMVCSEYLARAYASRAVCRKRSLQLIFWYEARHRHGRPL